MAEEIGIDKSTVCSWVRAYRKKNGMPTYAEEKRVQALSANEMTEENRRIKDLEKENRRLLRENGIEQSMSRTGCPYDNACSESFFATAKKECIYLKKYGTIEEVKKDIYEYIELFYNRKRMHSHPGYMSPVEYRLKHCA